MAAGGDSDTTIVTAMAAPARLTSAPVSAPRVKAEQSPGRERQRGDVEIGRPPVARYRQAAVGEVGARRQREHAQRAEHGSGDGHRGAEHEQRDHELPPDAQALRHRETERTRLEIAGDKGRAEERASEERQDVDAHVLRADPGGRARVAEMGLDARNDERDRERREHDQQPDERVPVLSQHGQDDVLTVPGPMVSGLCRDGCHSGLRSGRAAADEQDGRGDKEGRQDDEPAELDGLEQEEPAARLVGQPDLDVVRAEPRGWVMQLSTGE